MRLAEPFSAVPELMLMILPQPRARMCGTTAREASQVPRRLTAIMRSHSSISISSKGERDIGTVAKIAALFTRTSICPNASIERLVEGADAVRHAAQVRMQGDRHDAPRLGAFFVENFELPDDHVAELVRRAVALLERRLVVDLRAVGHGHEPPPAPELHRIGLIVVHPVADVLAAFRRQKFERVPGFLEPRAEPADGPRARRLRDRVERAADGAALLARAQLVQAPRVALVVPHELPLARPAFLDDLGMLTAELAVQRDRAAP